MSWSIAEPKFKVGDLVRTCCPCGACTPGLVRRVVDVHPGFFSPDFHQYRLDGEDPRGHAYHFNFTQDHVEAPGDPRPGDRVRTTRALSLPSWEVYQVAQSARGTAGGTIIYLDLGLGQTRMEYPFSIQRDRVDLVPFDTQLTAGSGAVPAPAPSSPTLPEMLMTDATTPAAPVTETNGNILKATIEAATKPLADALYEAQRELTAARQSAEFARVNSTASLLRAQREHQADLAEVQERANIWRQRYASLLKRHENTERQLNDKVVVMTRTWNKLQTAQRETELDAAVIRKLLDERDEFKRLYEERRTPIMKIAEAASTMACATGGAVKGAAAATGRAARATAALPVRAARGVGAFAADQWRRTRVLKTARNALVFGTLVLCGASQGYGGYQCLREGFALSATVPAAANPLDPRERAWLAQRAADQAKAAEVSDAAFLDSLVEHR